MKVEQKSQNNVKVSPKIAKLFKMKKKSQKYVKIKQKLQNC